MFRDAGRVVCPRFPVSLWPMIIGHRDAEHAIAPETRGEAFEQALAADGLLREAARGNTPDRLAFADGLGRALELGDLLIPRAALIDSALNGLQLGLLQGGSPGTMEEDYHRFWLTVLP